VNTQVGAIRHSGIGRIGGLGPGGSPPLSR
jgi:hypothetical protein